MQSAADAKYSILIVSSHDRLVMRIKKLLTGFLTIDVKKNATAARRSLIERDYDIIVIDAPLSDESGIEFASDAVEQKSPMILIISPMEVYDDVLDLVSNKGILAITKDMVDNRLSAAISYLSAMSMHMHTLEDKTLTLEEKIRDIRIVNKAKATLVRSQGITEDEAHRLIGKTAMDKCITRAEAATWLVGNVE